MVKSKRFAGYAVALNIMGIVFMFLYSGLQNDQISIIQAFSAWSATDTQVPMTVGGLVCIVLTFVFGTCFLKFGVRKTLIPCIIIAALGCLGIAAANGLATVSGLETSSAAPGDPAVVGNFALFWVSLFIVRCFCMCLQLAGFMLVANWFIRYRGRVMGIITVGSPLFSVVGTAGMTSLITNRFGGDYRPFYIGIAVLLVVVAVLTGLLLRDKPEDAGLWPDGADSRPKSESEDDVHLSVGDVLRQGKAWKLIVSFGIFQSVIQACMGSMAVWYMSLGGLEVWLSATKWLAMGSILGIPMSYIFGILDDKIGSVKTSMILGATELIPVIALMLQPQGGSVPLMILWGFGVACMTGGVPTMHPCITAYCYGRKEYQAANRVIMSIQLIPFAFAALYTTYMITSGRGMLGYGSLIVLIIIGIAVTATLLKLPDSNAADRY